MLYGVLGGFGFFVLLPLLIALYFTWAEYTHSEDRIVFPSGTQVTRTNDYDGFPANGTATITVHILPNKSEEFAQQLQKNGFQESPIPGNIQLQLRYVSEAESAAQVINGLWYFKDETPRNFKASIITPIYLKFMIWTPASITASNPIPEHFKRTAGQRFPVRLCF